MMTQPPMLTDKAYQDNFALYMKFVEMLPSGPIWDRDKRPMLALSSDAVGYALAEFFRLLIGDHWEACASDGTPMWYLIQEDIPEAIEQLKGVMAQMQKLAPPQMQCGVTSRFDEPDDAAWDPVWTAFALRHAVSTGELTVEHCRPTDMEAFEKFIEPHRIDMETAYALVDDVPHVAGWVQGDYQFWVWDIWPIGKRQRVVVIEDAPYAGCYCLPPLSEWATFVRQGETDVT